MERTGKRKIEIDLTDDDKRRTLQMPRTMSDPGPSSQAWMSESEDEAEILVTSQTDRNEVESFELYGTLHTSIPGINYYKGHATVGEHVLIRRDPSNSYDFNAIRVYNVRGQQIGHINSSVTRKLAPYVDAGELYLNGTLALFRGQIGFQLIIGLYGPCDAVTKARLRERMTKDGFPLEKEDELRRRADLMKVAKKGAAISGRRRAQWTSTNADPKYAGSSSQGPDFNPGKMRKVVEEFGVGEETMANLPFAAPPERLSTEMLPYQRQALAWLLDKENPRLPPVGSTDVVQLWKRAANDTFINIATKFCTRDKSPTLASGGILADDTGLGKTLQMIALIAADMDLPQQASPSDEIRTTLIVSPVSVMSNWSGQMAQHVKSDNPLRVMTYHGTDRKDMKAADFARYDVVITSYGILSKEYLPRVDTEKAAPPPRPHGLYSVRWRRVVLDEGHTIRNPYTKSALAATSISARSKWAVTGTPVVNSLKDLYSLVRFIGLTGGLDRLQIFNSALILPLRSGDLDGPLVLRALMSTVCLRRRKDMSFIDLRLPELSEHVQRIKFFDNEQEKYNALQAEAKGMIQTYTMRQGNGDSWKAQAAYHNLLEILLLLRQLCNHWKLCRERVTSLMSILEAKKTVDLNLPNIRALQSMLRLSIESREDCPICLEELEGRSPVITHCGHIFGSDCINRAVSEQHRCPMCRARLIDETYLVKPAAGLGEDDPLMDADTASSSSKVEALLGILTAAQQKPGTKTVVFSQWSRFLDIVQVQLSTRGLGFARIDGSMSVTRRDEALRALRHDPGTTVLLATLGACTAGLNLVAANQVVLCDSWLAPTVEDQAVDRVHRLGQKRPTTVWRLVMDGSIEERTLEIQAKKRHSMMDASVEGSRATREGPDARLRDIQALLA